ncbi:conserved exported hypothetical protein [Verrucomicrobia bacterium]|nr:conserved exported hypothetical protein [Verrucomicrobiota bacterium]
MKTSLRLQRGTVTLAAFCLQGLSVHAVTFTNDTLISFYNSNYDGQPIVVSNCTVTIDGSHLFADVHLLSGGVLTHSPAFNGVLTNLVQITNEQQLVSSTNPAVLSQTNVLTNTVVVTDLTGSNIYALGTDYALAASNNSTLLVYLTGSTISDGSTVLVSYQAVQTVSSGMNLTVTNNFQIETGGAINANGNGYGAGNGPGEGKLAYTTSPFPYYAGSGGGYGGSGGSSSSGAPGGVCNGTVSNSSSLGSGGGGGSNPFGGFVSGGAGGGSIIVAVSGLLRVDGSITANGADGTNTFSGGGSGGGIHLAAQTFFGAGLISANGGAGDPYFGGGGGGGASPSIL